MKKPNRVKLLISCGADIGVKNSEGLSALYFINKNVPECMKNFEQRLDTGVSLSQSRDERRIELSTNLREVSQCLEKAPTRTFSLLRAPTSPATESYRRFVDSSSSGESAGDPGNVPPRPTQLHVHCPAQHPSISISNPLGCIP